MIDWDVARRAGGAVLGERGVATGLPGDLIAIAAEAEERVVAYTGLVPIAPLPTPEALDREAWLEANLASMRSTLAPVEAGVEDGLSWAGPAAGALRAGAGGVLGAEIGGLAGYLGRRVLGQYELALLEPDPVPRLLFVAPNLRGAAAELEVDEEALLTWVGVHEVTHAVQFGAVTWLRPHLAELLRELLGTVRGGAGGLGLPTAESVARLVGAVRSGDLVSLVAGPERTALLDRVQATMALVEGHAEHVMDAVGADVLPDLDALRAALDRRRADRPTLLGWLERLLGMELKLRQYAVGKAFCDGVVDAAGVVALHRAFAAPELVPTLAELEDPEAWVRRTSVP